MGIFVLESPFNKNSGRDFINLSAVRVKKPMGVFVCKLDWAPEFKPAASKAQKRNSRLSHEGDFNFKQSFRTIQPTAVDSHST